MQGKTKASSLVNLKSLKISFIGSGSYSYFYNECVFEVLKFDKSTPIGVKFICTSDSGSSFKYLGTLKI